MGRPKLGAGAKSVVATVRLTPQEVGALTARFGSVAKGLRAALDALLSGEPDRKRLAGRKVVKEDIAAVMDVPVEVLAVEGQMDYNAAVGPKPPAPAHRHRRGAVIRVDYEYGTPKNVYACAQCGEELA